MANKKTETKKSALKKQAATQKAAAPKTRKLWNGEQYVTVNI